MDGRRAGPGESIKWKTLGWCLNILPDLKMMPNEKSKKFMLIRQTDISKERSVKKCERILHVFHIPSPELQCVWKTLG